LVNYGSSSIKIFSKRSKFEIKLTKKLRTAIIFSNFSFKFHSKKFLSALT